MTTIRAVEANAKDRLFALAAELGDARRKFRLEEMRTLCEALGRPERRFASVLIAGTNGKGSTAAALASIVSEAGYRTGLYTSPHLESVNERIRIGGEMIDDEAFSRAFAQVEAAAGKLQQEGRLPQPPSFFEAVTATAFVAFAEAGIEIAVLEVGMGGRLDATNVVEPLISVITDIALDHMEYLGSTISAIAREKAGILRPNGTLVTLPQHPEANQSIGEVATALGARGVNAAIYLPFLDPTQAGAHNRYPLTVLEETIEIDAPLEGAHQQRNLALAIAAAAELRNHQGYKIDAQQIARGIHATRWPGRFELVRQQGRADVLLDVAHNPAGAWALRSALAHLEPAPASMTLVFGCLRDKALDEMAQILFPIFDRVVLAAVDSPRAATMESLREAAATVQADALEAADPAAALETAWEITPQEGLVVVAGSVYLVGALRKKAISA
ncbi:MULTISPECIES: folylpolyglutamate synthase/dihydrofolate synthase family protein [Acidobacterium]|uniref:Dihydrofolate synthase/folylpolyglutamate synthase n=1 Tax=Acidobacterium capsulatum (strain ATCC 51196 / DSM 11244 / BCRC 80197 / JCM 7670 / NBRC 15755 / NCIMB 13165 / 161) TaxID=240015 RepID=C1F9L2_ACIC5|nr:MULTISPECIES: folylpolyglutamate synthase/dihydrofolate synthase family protein [Acidobacterium]ACO34483.1 tetrahydrofolate synthase [Acidobacterium capsulatum ATCC 51196]HCT62219.1 bifunctional folylpolyglutamate synthase/dihydrofolate synthase [Acidobacterium sp.]